MLADTARVTNVRIIIIIIIMSPQSWNTIRYRHAQQSWRAAKSGVAGCVNTRPTARPRWPMACCQHRTDKRNRQT